MSPELTFIILNMESEEQPWFSKFGPRRQIISIIWVFVRSEYHHCLSKPAKSENVNTNQQFVIQKTL